MTKAHEMKAAHAVDEGRLWERLMTMAQYGATPAGGVNRQALSAEDIAARRQMKAWADEYGFVISTDDIGNLFVRREGTLPEAEPIITGSHIDSQPKGGKFDGIYGVMAGLGGSRGARRRCHFDQAADRGHSLDGRGGEPVPAGAYGLPRFYGPTGAGEGVRHRRFGGCFGRAGVEGNTGGRARHSPASDRLFGRRLYRNPHRARADPGGRGKDHRRRHRNPGDTLVWRSRCWERKRMPAPAP